MFKLLFTNCLLAVTAFISFSQDFPEKDAQFFMNATVKPVVISEQLQTYAYKNFYIQFDTVSKILLETEIGKKKAPFKPFQVGSSYTAKSDYTKLVGQEYKVTGVYELPGKYDFDKGEYFILALRNSEGTIFYKYNSRYKHDLELEVVGGLQFPEGYFCKKITTTVDKFEAKTTYMSPKEGGYSFMKVVSEKDTTIYLSVEEGGSTANVGITGLYLLFEDGTKLERKDAKIDVKVSNSGRGYIYSAFISLSKSEIEMLMNKNLTDNRLYVYDGTVSKESAKIIREYIKCMNL